jgi:hypothetical protein
MQQPTSDQATGGQDGHRHVVFAADVAAGYDVLAGTHAAAHSDMAGADSGELPVSCLTPADSSACAADSEVAASVLRSRPSAVGDSSGLVTGVTEVANPSSRHPSGVPVLRRSGTSLAHDGSAFAAIDMPQLLSRQGSLLNGPGNDGASCVDSSSSSAGSSRGLLGGSDSLASQPAAASNGIPCFGRMRPSVAIALSALCLLAAVSIFSAWLPDSVHTAAHHAVQKAMAQQSIFEPRQDIVIVFKQAGFTGNSCNSRLQFSTQNFASGCCSALFCANTAYALSGLSHSSCWLQDSALLADLHTVCGRTHAGAEGAVRRHPVSSTCNLAKACSHVFGSVMHGIAGRFTRCGQQQSRRLIDPAVLQATL